MAPEDMFAPAGGPLPLPLICDLIDLDHFLNDYRGNATMHIPREKFIAFPSRIYCPESSLQIGGMRRQMTNLIESKRNLTILIYNGDTDLRCDFLGTKWFIESLGRRKVTDFEPWRDASGQILGHVQQFDGLTFATILGAGHSPTGSRPALVYSMLDLFIKSTGSRRVELKSIQS